LGFSILFIGRSSRGPLRSEAGWFWCESESCPVKAERTFQNEKTHRLFRSFGRWIFCFTGKQENAGVNPTVSFSIVDEKSKLLQKQKFRHSRRSFCTQ